jgi:diguanylate cyclase (GGDEF)-like protein/PAS domain S-box-containing protein
MFGTAAAQLCGCPAASLFQAGQSGDPPPAASSSGSALGILDGRMCMLRPDGERRWLDVSTVWIDALDGEGSWALSVFSDQTAAYQTGEALRAEQGLLETLLDAMPDHIYFKDRDSRIIRANRAQAAYFGLEDPAGELGKTDFDFYAPEVATVLFAEEQAIMRTRQPLVGAIEDHSARVGHPLWLQSTKVPMVRAGQVVGLVGISRDITELKLTQEQFAYQALHDPLTGVPNRTLLLDRFDQALHRALREHTTLAVCLLDLDHFKVVNDALGHQQGDRVLQEAATRVFGALRGADTVARIGGDEFALLLPGAGAAEALAIAERIGAALRAPLELDGCHVDLAGSIGIALFPLHGEDAATLLARADLAMYAAKLAGRRIALVYDGRLDAANPAHIAAHHELYRAIGQNGILLHHQHARSRREPHGIRGPSPTRTDAT